MRDFCYCKIKLSEGAVLPEKKHPEDAGYDLYANENVVLAPGAWDMVSTGVYLEPDTGWYIQIVPRSGLAAKFGISVLNTPGTIDSNYRNEIKVIVVNHSQEPYSIKRGDRIAQMIFTPSYEAVFDKVDVLGDSDRGLGGFGSTGK